VDGTATPDAVAGEILSRAQALLSRRRRK